MRAGGATLAIALVLLLPGRARAEPTSELETLLSEPVISTASKSAERASEAPGTSSVVTAEEINRHGLRSLNEVINYASLGMITSNPLHSVEIGARGVLVNADYGNHVLVASARCAASRNGGAPRCRRVSTGSRPDTLRPSSVLTARCAGFARTSTSSNA